MTTLRPATALVALIAMALVGCSAPAASNQPAPDASTPPATTTTATIKTEPTSAAQAGIDPAQPPKPLVPGVTVEVTTWNEKQPASTTVEVVRLERRGKLAVAVFAVTPTSSGTKVETLHSWLGGTGPSPALIDPMGLKRYGVVSASGPVSSEAVQVRMSAGQTAYYYAVFAAPPADVTAVDVVFASNIPPFSSVPLS